VVNRTIHSKYYKAAISYEIVSPLTKATKNPNYPQEGAVGGLFPPGGELLISRLMDNQTVSFKPGRR
jgi:hypothetical protein